MRPALRPVIKRLALLEQRLIAEEDTRHVIAMRRLDHLDTMIRLLAGQPEVMKRLDHLDTMLHELSQQVDALVNGPEAGK